MKGPFRSPSGPGGAVTKIAGKDLTDDGCNTGAEFGRETHGCLDKRRIRGTAPFFYQVTTCHLPDFDVEAFAEALGDRTIYALGDSLMRQNTARLRCLLRKAADRGDIPNRTSPRVVPFYVTTTDQFEKRVKSLADRQTMKPTDVCLVNFGVHFNKEAQYRLVLDRFEEVCLKEKCLPCQMVWVETTAQHFPGSRKLGGYFSSAKQTCSRNGCAASSVTPARRADFRNVVATQVMRRNRVPVIPLWAASQAAHHMHVQFYATGNICDCTHYCNSPHGFFRFYHRLLQSYLTAGSAMGNQSGAAALASVVGGAGDAGQQGEEHSGGGA